MTKPLMAGVVQTLAALIALLVCTTTAFAQPAVQQVVTQARACGPWAQPLTITLPADRRVSIARVAELLAEDASDAQFQASLPVPAGELPFRRTSTRAPRTMHETSLNTLVAGIYTGSDANVRTALIARLREIIARAGMTYTSLEEKRLCCLTRSSSGERLCQSPTSMTCEDGLPPRLISRNRYLRAGFSDNFYAESFVAADSFDRTDWRGTPGYNFRVFLKPGRRPFIMNVARVYDAAHHPRPAAALCRELPLLATAPPPTDALAKEQIFSHMAELTANTIAEGDLTAAMWATQIVRDVSVRIADLEALRHAQLEIEDRNHRLQARWQEVQRVRADRDRANVLRARWQMVSIAAIVVSIAAIIASIFIGLRTHRRVVKREMRTFLTSIETELFQWRLFLEIIIPKDDAAWEKIQSISPSNIKDHLLDSDSCTTFLEAARFATKAALDRAEASLNGFNRLIIDMVGQDDMAKILGLTTARSETSGSLILKGPVLTPRQARVMLESLVNALRVCSAARINLGRTLEVRGSQLKSLANGVYEAMGAASFELAKLILTDALVKTLQDEELVTLRISPRNDNTPPPGAAPAG